MIYALFAIIAINAAIRVYDAIDRRNHKRLFLAKFAEGIAVIAEERR